MSESSWTNAKVSLAGRGACVPSENEDSVIVCVCVKEELSSRCRSGSLLVLFVNVSSQMHRFTKNTPPRGLERSTLKNGIPEFQLRLEIAHSSPKLDESACTVQNKRNIL